MPPPTNPLDDPDYEPPPPALSGSFFAWLSPVIHVKEHEMIKNIGMDATVFLRFVRMLIWIFAVVSVYGVVLIILYVLYNRNPDNKVAAADKQGLGMLTSMNVQGNFIWGTLAVSYLITLTVMFFVWQNWHAVVMLRHHWFRSPGYTSKIYSRTLMITQVPKTYRSDEGLVHLMGQLKVDGIKIRDEIDCATIGRRLGDFPKLVHDHNEAVRDLERALTKYLKHDKMAAKRPTVRKGGFMGIGGTKHDAIDYFAKQVKFLRDKIDARREVIDSLIRQERKARKQGKPMQRIEGENYGFITFRTIAEAHRIARRHQGKLKELGGARLHFAPPPRDILWENLAKDPAEIATARTFGFVWIAVVCFLNTLPLTLVAILANLGALSQYVGFIGAWQAASPWSLNVVSGVLPATVQGVFGFLLPYIIRRISKKQGAPTRSKLDRGVIARYFFFMIVSSLIVLVLLSLFFNFILGIIQDLTNNRGAGGILNNLKELPWNIQRAYVSFSNYWLTWLPLRGFLLFFELIQLIKLAMVSWRRVMFSYTPRDIRDITRPPSFEYSIVVVNLLFIAAVGLVYAPLAPLVAIGALFAFCFSLMVYKYQLLYVYITKAESGGRMWNVYVNRLYVGVILMQLLMVLTVALVRPGYYWYLIAAAPPIPILIVFKIFMVKTAEADFRYYRPSPQEIEIQNRKAMTEKRIKASDLEKRFLNPSLLPDKLFGVMVHKSQESLTRQVLEPYPWFAAKNARDGVQIKAVREENLEYNPERDGPADERQQEDWETKSIASTMALSKMDGNGSDAGSLYGGVGGGPVVLAQSNASFQRVYNPSTDELLSDPARSDTYGMPTGAPRRYGGGRDREDSEAPLLVPWSGGSGGTPYPPSSFQRPPLAHRGTSSSTDLGGRTSNDSMGHHPRGQGSGGSARDLYPARSRGSVGDALEQYAQVAGPPGYPQTQGTRSRSGSAGHLLYDEAMSRTTSNGSGPADYGRRPSEGSVQRLDQYGRRPSAGSTHMLDQYNRPGSAGSGQILDAYNRPGSAGSNRMLDSYGRPSQAPPYGQPRGGYGY
ncbi:DUF221-domain-containing protein [Cutaneotrichosporon oleaginosum]|uniref:DUF221-domain-containing protein n=1 Tax=Cutaneotrichosporon oleaginosum TaxID=879819 RepID=A0A0J0XBB2_9TREE|nr:DUF221-domain-containing protein [Cutaneotrichosporon oleaginosum]KLT38381.1 DUF221-domain-containing protein [Cutaneotrichosporon oleaginosum]TXT07809.1 hypothetical protein COLE_04733 [Cutaneotrichosporon oleaginosum]